MVAAGGRCVLGRGDRLRPRVPRQVAEKLHARGVTDGRVAAVLQWVRWRSPVPARSRALGRSSKEVARPLAEALAEAKAWGRAILGKLGGVVS